MLHAAGIEHEHSRSNRDDYIRLVKENLGNNINDINLAKEDTFVRNPYDYESVMHYHLKVWTYFSVDFNFWPDEIGSSGLGNKALSYTCLICCPPKSKRMDSLLTSSGAFLTYYF